MEINKLCRICGELLLGPNPLVVKIHGEKLEKALLKDCFANDLEGVHPAKMCLRCYSKIRNIADRGHTDVELTVKEWSVNPIVNIKRGRRPKIKVKGRPKNNSCLRWTRLFLNNLILPIIQNNRRIYTSAIDTSKNKEILPLQMQSV